MIRLTRAILIAALLPVAILNGYAQAVPASGATQEAPSQKDVPSQDKPVSPDDAPGQNSSTPTAPVAGLPAGQQAPVDSLQRLGRATHLATSRTLPVGMWHGLTLAVPRPFSRLDRVVSLSGSSAAALRTIACAVQAHAPPIGS